MEGKVERFRKRSWVYFNPNAAKKTMKRQANIQSKEPRETVLGTGPHIPTRIGHDTRRNSGAKSPDNINVDRDDEEAGGNDGKHCCTYLRTAW